MSKENHDDIPLASLSDEARTMPVMRLAVGDDAQTIVKLSDADIQTGDERADERKALEAFVGQTISDRYAIHELIGSGGMGAVYRGEQVHLRRRCAVKILLPKAALQQDLVLRFEREAIAGAHVKHPNVVEAVDFGKLPDGSRFLVLEYVEGTSLEDLMKQGPLPPARALSLARQIAMALAAVHEKGIVHRDVKPRNILLDAHDHIKLLDFGLAKVNLELLSPESRNAKPVPALTGAGVVMGTFSYIAPEALKGMDAVDARSDLYALGVVLYELLAGKRPFDEKDPVMLFKRMGTEKAPSVHDRAPEVTLPASVEAIVAKLMERAPSARFASANELIAAIDAAAVDVKDSPARKETPKEDGAKKEEPAKTEEKASEKPAAEEPKKDDSPAPAPAPAPAAKQETPSKAPNRKIIFIGAGVLGLVLLIVLVVVLGGSSNEKKPTATAPSATTYAPAEPEVTLPVEIDGIDAAGWRERMRAAIPKKEWVKASRALLALVKLDPALVTSNEMRADVVTIVAGIGFDTSSAESEKVFSALANDTGPGGLDILFQIVRTRGGSKAANRANEILAQPSVMARATPALRVAYDLRRAACHNKRDFFTQAAEEGDARALDELLIAQQGRCPSRKDPCCYREDPDMKDAISKLRSRLSLVER